MIATIAVATAAGALGGVLGLLAMCRLYDWATEPDKPKPHYGHPYGEL